ncbi:putative Membrane protein [Nitrospira japonica]|uniref:Putative Membrane protein n=1 Tax=Nitrospira japonica TaxID=1325564 RepID=A0A1W1I6X0_9BACT|nr:CHASE2 domain-containing protein [Nitrospira japonica]SLM48671.1 putative Membrane protein [Nitrospira japonica]
MGAWIQRVTAPLHHPALMPLRRRWRRFPPFLQHLVKSLGIGVMAALLLHAARPYVPGLAGAETAATDWAIKFWQDRLDTARAAEERFVFLDIDEATHRSWGEPLFVPRDKLLSLIQFAVDAPAKLLVVDIELTKHVPLSVRQAGSDAAPGTSASSDGPDEILAAYLRRYSERAGAAGTATPTPASPPMHILIARTIGLPLRTETAAPAETLETSSGPLREERPSELLENIVERSTVLHWASPLSDRDDDGLVRNWRLFEPTCLNRSPHAVPSVALLSWGILRRPQLSQEAFSPREFQTELQSRFSPLPQACGEAAPEHSAAPANSWTLHDDVLAKPVTLSTKPSDLEQRIFYKFHPSTSLAGQLSRISARLITEHEAGRPLSREWVAGKIVVIGTSFEFGKDMHATPIGDMPGAVVVINQINALMEFGQFQEVSRSIRWTGLLLLIAVFSLSFSLFTKTWGARVSTLVVNAVLLPLSLWLFQYGWWLDLVFPLFVLQAYQKFVDIEIAPQPLIRRHRHADEHT